MVSLKEELDALTRDYPFQRINFYLQNTTLSREKRTSLLKKCSPLSIAYYKLNGLSGFDPM